MSKKDVIKPILFVIPNEEFPSNRNQYCSNVVTFIKPITNDIIEGVEKDRYDVNTQGEIYDNKLGHDVPVVCSKGNKFYEQVCLSTSQGPKVRKVHRIVKMTFDPIDNPEKFQVNHIDGDHANNELENLEWCTDQYNRIHSLLNGLEDTVFGIPAVKLYPVDLDNIKKLHKEGYSYEKILDKLDLRIRGATRHTIGRIINNKSIYSKYYHTD